MREVNVENYIGWKDKLFMFDEEDMVTIMNKLTRWYDVDIIIETPELKDGFEAEVYVNPNQIEVYVNNGEAVISNTVYDLGKEITADTETVIETLG